MFFLTSKAASHRSWVRGWLRRCHLPCVNGDSCFHSFASFFSLWLFSPWVPVPKDRMFVLSPSWLKTTAHVIRFLFSFSGHAFPLQWSLAELAGRWQCGHEGWWLRGQSIAGVHMNDTQCPSHLWWCKRHPVPGKAKEQGGRGCLKELFLLENMTERVQQGGKAQSPAAETVGGRQKLKQHSGCVWTKKFGILTVADRGTAGFTEILNVVCIYRSMLSYPVSLSDFRYLTGRLRSFSFDLCCSKWLWCPLPTESTTLLSLLPVCMSGGHSW